MKQIISLFITCCSLIWLINSGCKKDQAASFDPGAAIIIDSFTPSLGSGRTEILINGHNFTSDTANLKVSIGDHPLKIIGASVNQIMALVPKKCGSGVITVAVGNKQAQSSNSFRYLFTHTVTTLAGNGEPGYVNAKGTDAQFHFTDPVNNWYRSMGIAVDDQLNVYVADPGNHCIRKIDSAGNVTTLAGNPNVSGHTDGQGLQAAFSLPYDIALDKAGNLYTADPGNWDIRKITPDGQATTLFFAAVDPWSLAVDPSGQTVYYSSCRNPGPVYRVDLSSGSAEKILDNLNYPAAIRLDTKGNLYSTMNGSNVITRFESGSWSAKDIAGLSGAAGYENGTGADARFSLPWGLAVDTAGNLYVAGNGTWNGGTDHPDQSIRMIETGSWNVSTFAGSGSAGYTEGVGAAAAFSAPGGVAVDKHGTVYVLDKNNNAVRKIVSE